LITERRRHAPSGSEGGEPGAVGRNLLDGEELPPKAIGRLEPGQRLRIETPGGGGHGRKDAGGHGRKDAGGHGRKDAVVAAARVIPPGASC
jgi:N-methylhydantoinase B